MSVHYKFKSALEYDTVTFDGLHISVKDLKNAIVQQKRIGKSTDFDLQVTNAQTKEVYDDDKALIPKNTSLLIARIPTTSQTKNKQWEGYGGDNTPPTKLDEGGPIAKAVDLSSLDAPEDDKIKAMMSQSTQDYDPSNYTKIRGANQMGPVPPNYRCYKCHQTGHWIKDCPLSKGPEPIEIKKSTGIPLSFMVPVEGPQVQGAMMTPNGSYAVPVLDHQTYTQKPSAPAPIPETKPEIPEELLCSICSDLLTDTVMIPCCGNSFCDECIRSHLLESDDHECPDCHEKDVYPGTLIPNRHLRSRVAKFKNTTGYVKKPVYRPSLVKAVEEIEIKDSAPPPATDQEEGDELNANAETEKTVISEADSTEHTKVEEKETVKTEAEVKPDPEPNEGPPGVSPAESPKVTISKRSTTSTRERSSRESSSRTHKSREHRSTREDSPRRHRNHRSSPFQEQGRNEERAGTPTIDEPGPRGGSSSTSHSHHSSSEVRPPYSSGSMPPLIGTVPTMQGPPPQMGSNYSSQPPMGAYPPANGPPPNFRLPPPGGPMPPYMAPGPYPVPPRPIYDSSRQPMSGPPPMYNPSYAPGSRTHHSRDYPISDRRMRGRTPSGVIDDPLAAFNRMLREKDERERRAKRIQRRSYSRSRSRSRSYSRSPRRLRSRSPRRRQSRSRSRSFSLSRSRSRSFSGSVRGSPFRDFSPRHSPRPRRGPSRYRSPIRSPPRHRFKDNHQNERFRDRDYERERDHDHDRDREREHRDRDRERERDYIREERAYSREREHIREHRVGRDEREREERGRGGPDRDHHHRGEREARHDRDKRERDYGFYEGGYGEDAGGRVGIRGKPPPHQWSGPGMPPGARGPSHPEAGYFPPPLEIHGGHPPHPYAAPPNRYPPRDYVPPQFKNEPPHLMPQPSQIPPHLLPPSQRPRFEDIAPPGVEEPPIPGLEPEQRFEDRFERFPPPKELMEKHEEELKEREEKKEKERVEKKEERKRKHRSRSREKSSRRSPSEVSRKKSKSISPEKRSVAKRKKREPSSDGERDKKISHSDEEKAPKRSKERKKKKEKKDSEKKKRKDKKSKHRKDEKEPKEKKHKEDAREEPEKEDEPFEEPLEERERPPPTPELREEFEEELPKLQLYDDDDDIAAMPKAMVLAEKESSIERTPEKLIEEPEVEPEIPEESSTPQKEYEDSEKDILEIHTTDIDLKAELEKNEMLAHMPEKSKWEVEEDVSSQTSPRDSGKYEKVDKSGKVTNEVLKRAENAIFAKAINAIRPIEIKKISTDRAKLYSGEKEEGEHDDEVEIRNVQIEENVDRKKVDPPVRLSVKERLGVKIDELDKPVKVDMTRKKSRSLSPFSRRTNEAARNYGVGERRVEVVERKRYDDRRRSRERRRDRRESRDSRKESYRRRDRDENRREGERKERKDRSKSKSKHRDDEKEPPKKARVIRSPSEERKDKRKKKEKRTKKEKSKKHQDDRDETKMEEVKPKIEKRKPTIDEASFEPDYDLESESEKEESKEKSRKSEDRNKSESSSDSSETSSDEVRKRKKHRKHKKKPREETSSSSSESESDSSDDEKERKKRKHKKKLKKKKKSKHK